MSRTIKQLPYISVSVIKDLINWWLHDINMTLEFTHHCVYLISIYLNVKWLCSHMYTCMIFCLTACTIKFNGTETENTSRQKCSFSDFRACKRKPDKTFKTEFAGTNLNVWVCKTKMTSIKLHFQVMTDLIHYICSRRRRRSPFENLSALKQEQKQERTVTQWKYKKWEEW